MLALLALAAQTIAEPALRIFAPLVGHCWQGQAPGGAGTDTHCFEAVYGGEHVRDRHTVLVDAKAVYLGETLYSVEGETVSFTYWNSLGGIGRGTVAAQGSEILFSGSMRQEPSSAAAPLHATWRLTSDGYEVVWPDGTPHLMKRVDGSERVGL
jgi:hypothetical protein